MTFRHRFHATNDGMSCIAPRIADPEIRESWRTLARPVTLFDEPSPANFLAGEIGEFFCPS